MNIRFLHAERLLVWTKEPMGVATWFICLILLAANASAESPYGKVPAVCAVGETVIFDGSNWICAAPGAAALKLRDSTGAGGF